MDLKEAKRILTLVARDPDHGTKGAWEDQDIAAKTVLRELSRLSRENKALKNELKNKEKLK